MRSRAAWAAATATVVAGALPAAAQTPPGPAVSVGVTQFTPWNDPVNSTLSIGLRVRNTGSIPIERPRVRVTVHDRVLSRSALRSALDGRPRDVTFVTTEPFADPLAPGASADVRVDRDLAVADASFRRRSAGGVYPVEIEVRGSDRSLWTGWAAAVFFPTPPATRLNVAWVLPIHSPVLYDAAATTYPGASVDRVFGPSGTLPPAVRGAAKAAQQVPVTLAVTGSLLDMLADVADGFARRDGRRVVQATPADAAPRAAADALAHLRTVTEEGSRAQLATTPYGHADLVSLVHADLQADAARHLTAAAQRTTARMGREPRRDVLVPAGLRIDSRSAATAGAFGVRTIVADPSLVPTRSGIFGPDQPVRVTGRGGVELDVLLADEPIRARLERAASQDANRPDPLLAAQGAIAETASGWYERPKLAGARGLVIATTTTPHARTIAALAEGLAVAPWVQMRTAADLPVAVPPGEDPVALPLGRAEPGDLITALRRAKRAVDVLGRVVADPAGATEDLERRLLAAESLDWEDDPRGTELALAVKSDTDAIVRRIHASEKRRVTLTSRTGRLPVTIINDTRFKVRVRVRLESAKVEFPAGSNQIVEIGARGRQTITFPAKALATGAFGVAVELRTPDGAIPIGTESIVVRSTAVSFVALITIFGGIAVLLAAWLRRGRRRRVAIPAGTG